MKKINTNDIPTPATVVVRGTLTYSRLHKQLDGKDLEDYIEDRKKTKRPYVDKPFTTATIVDPRIEFSNPAGETDPNARTIAEQYIIQKMYQSKNSKNYAGRWLLEMNNTGNFVPRIFVETPKGSKNLVETKLTGRVQNNLDVSLVIRIYAAEPNNGVTLDSVIFHDPIKYYDNATVLNQFGYTITETIDQPANAAANNGTNDTINFEPPTEPDYPAAPATPYSSQPAPQQPAQAVPQEQTVAAANPYAQPTQPAANTQPAVSAATAANPYAQPVQPAANPYASNVGITYDPTKDPNRQYT